jgi:hypothetical protein
MLTRITSILLFFYFTLTADEFITNPNIEMYNLRAMDGFDISSQKDESIDKRINQLAQNIKSKKKAVVVQEVDSKEDIFKKSINLKCGGKCGLTVKFQEKLNEKP